jgi:hypothetical protein
MVNKKIIIIGIGNIPEEEINNYIKKLNEKYPSQLSFEVFRRTAKLILWEKIKQWIKL